MFAGTHHPDLALSGRSAVKAIDCVYSVKSFLKSYFPVE